MATTQTATTANLLAPRPTAAPSSAPTQRIRPYKEFLTPLLHRRFTHAAVLIFGVCYVTSIILSPPSLLWIWNPLSTTGIRALLLFLPCLAVFIVRVANLHCGTLNSNSQAEWTTKLLGGWKGWHTLGWYLYSAIFFGEVYIWSRAKSSGLEWVDRGREYERARVNENPMFLRAVWLCMALAQTFIHLWREEDQIPIPDKDEDPIAAPNRSEETSGLTRVIQSKTEKEFRARIPLIGSRVAKMALPGLAFTLPVYFIVLRQFFWPYFYLTARTFFSNLPYYSPPTGLQNMMTLFGQAIFSSATLITLWEFSNAAFTIFVARPPLAKTAADPLTGSANSKDPNGSLITGLKAKKEVPRTFAFWELSLICQFFDLRRKSIYTEVDRINGSTWTQISQLCLDELTAIQTRIKAFQQSNSPAPAPAPSHPDLIPPSQPPEKLGLPKIADRSVVSNAALVNNPPASFERTISNVAKSYGQSPNSSPLPSRAKKAIEWSQEAGLTRQNLTSEANSFLTQALRTPVGEPLRQTFARRVRGVVLGMPESATPTIVHASKALSTLCARSLKEDDFGQVAKSIALIIRTYVETITMIESFLRELKPHWTDVYFTQQDRRVEEVAVVVGKLKEGLEDVVLAFGEYASSVGVSKKELREARELVATRR